MDTIKNRLRQLRLERKLTMAEFSKAIGVSPGNVGDWESEKRRSIPGAAALVQIAKTYQVSLDWLLLGESPACRTCDGHALVSPEWEKNSQTELVPLREEDQLLLKKAAEELSDEDLRLLGLFARRLLPSAQKERKAPP